LGDFLSFSKYWESILAQGYIYIERERVSEWVIEIDRCCWNFWKKREDCTEREGKENIGDQSLDIRSNTIIFCSLVFVYMCVWGVVFLLRSTIAFNVDICTDNQLDVKSETGIRSLCLLFSVCLGFLLKIGLTQINRLLWEQETGYPLDEWHFVTRAESEDRVEGNKERTWWFWNVGWGAGCRLEV
jgi:hypothetical protein